MASPHVEGINWFPRNIDSFVTWGSEINLYKIIPKKEQKPVVTSKRSFDSILLDQPLTLFSF